MTAGPGVFHRILAPVELEPDEQGGVAGEGSVRALELAAALARGGEVCIVHATPDFTRYATWIPPGRIAELDADSGRYATRTIAQLAARHCTGATLRYVIEPGTPLDVILAAARRHAPDAIVLAASARRRVDRAFLGSTADKVIRHSSCPVFVVPSGVV